MVNFLNKLCLNVFFQYLRFYGGGLSKKNTQIHFMFKAALVLPPWSPHTENSYDLSWVLSCRPKGSNSETT